MAGADIFTGTNGAFDVNGQTLALDSWNVNIEASEIDGFNFTSQGFHESTTGRKKASISFSGYWDSSQNPSQNPVNLRAGSTATNLYCDLDATTDFRWEFANVLILSVASSLTADGRVEFSGNAVSQGSFKYPGDA